MRGLQRCCIERRRVRGDLPVDGGLVSQDHLVGAVAATESGVAESDFGLRGREIGISSPWKLLVNRVSGRIVQLEFDHRCRAHLAGVRVLARERRVEGHRSGELHSGTEGVRIEAAARIVATAGDSDLAKLVLGQESLEFIRDRRRNRRRELYGDRKSVV